MGTERIRDYAPVDDQLVLQPCWPIEFESGVKEAGVPQGHQGHHDACPAPVGELTGHSDVVCPWIVVDEVDGEAIHHRRAHGFEHLHEILQLVLQVRLHSLLEAVPPGRKARSGPIVLLLSHCAAPSKTVGSRG
jgi:hypothetical protein